VLALTTRNAGEITLALDGRLVRFDRPLRVSHNGKTQVVEVRPSLIALCRSMRERGDPQLAFTCTVTLPTAKK
jgi:hypothetical protein